MQTTTFLLAEDDPYDAFCVEQEFKHGPDHLCLRRVGDGVQAMEYLEGRGEYADRQRYPLPDAILLDLKMPRMNGFEFLEWLRQRAPEALRRTPVVVLSSSTMEADVSRVYLLGADSYVVKPADMRLYRACIKELGACWSQHLQDRSLAAVDVLA